jgi:dihydropteroate synthase
MALRREQLLKTTDARQTCDEVLQESSQKAEANGIKKWNIVIE